MKRSDGNIVLASSHTLPPFSFCSLKSGKRESDDAGDSSVDLRPHMGKSQTFRSSHRTGYENDNGLEWRRGKHSSENDGWEGRGSRRRNSDNGDWQIDHKRRPRLNSHSKVTEWLSVHLSFVVLSVCLCLSGCLGLSHPVF